MNNKDQNSEHRITLPTISVVMSVFNGEPYVSNAIQSILGQTYIDFEFILINDGSTDKTWHIISEFASKDQRIVPINQDNIGLTKSLNRGISLARAPYIARQDADDLSRSDRFSIQLPYLESGHYDLCCSRATVIETNRVTPRFTYYVPKRLLTNFMNPFIHGTFLIRKTALDTVGGYDESFLFAQDYRLTQMFYASRFRIKYLSPPLYHLRVQTSLKHKDIQTTYANRLKTGVVYRALKKFNRNEL